MLIKPTIHLNGFDHSLNLPKTQPPPPSPNPREKLFLSLFMSDLHQTFRISPISYNNMTYDVNDDPILQDFSQEPSTSSKSPNYPFSVKSCLILIKLSGYLSCHLTT